MTIFFAVPFLMQSDRSLSCVRASGVSVLSLNPKRIGCLGIPDDYAYMQPELVALLMRKVPPYLPAR